MSNDFKVIDEQLEASRMAFQSYLAGFLLSVVFTLLPYFIVTRHSFGTESLLWGVTLFGIAQLFIQVVFFLHLHKKSKPHWNIIVFVFALLIVAFLVVGSLWIMYHLDMNMMRVSPFNSNEGYIPQ